MQTSSGEPESASLRPVQFSESLAALIRTHGYTGNQKKLADAVGLSEAALSHYVKGRTTPSFDNLVALAEHFNVSLDYLVFGKAESLEAGPLSQDYMVGQMQTALNEASRQAARRLDLLTRLGRVMVESLEGAVEQMLSQPLTEAAGRTIDIPDQIALEAGSRSVSICSSISKKDPKTGRYSGTTFETVDGKVQAGPFLEVQATNLQRGIQYRQIVQGEPNTYGDRAQKLRANLASAGLDQEKLAANHHLRGSEEPILGTFIILRLEPATLRNTSRMAYERFINYFREDGLFAYLSIMDDLYMGGYPLAPIYRDSAERIFKRMWDHGQEL